MEKLPRFPFALSFLIAGAVPLRAEWTKVYDGPRLGYVRALAVIGTSVFSGTSDGDSSVMRSTNNGAGWNHASAGLPDREARAFAVLDTDLFAGLYNGAVFRSVNNGTNWNAAHAGMPHDIASEGTSLDVNAFAVLDSALFAGTDKGVFRTTNRGASWTAANTGLPTSQSEFSVFALAASGTSLFAGCVGAGLFRSTDNGANWTPVAGFPANGEVEAFAVSGSSVFAGTSSGVFRSATNGTAWDMVNSGLTNTSVGALAVSGGLLFAGTSAGVFLSANNGSSWTDVSVGLPGPGHYAFAVSGGYLFVGGYEGIWRRPLSEMTTSVANGPRAGAPAAFRVEGSRSISFTLSTPSRVSLKAFDASGREVAVLLAEDLSAGAHARPLNTAPLSDGLYFYRFQTGTSTETKKILRSR